MSRFCFNEKNWDLGDKYFRKKVSSFKGRFLPTLTKYHSTSVGFESFLEISREYNHAEEISFDVDLKKYNFF